MRNQAKCWIAVFLGGVAAAGIAQATDQSSAALAIDTKDGSMYGWAVDHPSQAAASRRATEECKTRGGNCRVVLEFSGGCGAYAVQRGDKQLYGWGTGSDRAAAESRAHEEVRKRGGTDAVTRVWGCNKGPLAPPGASESEKHNGVHFIYAQKILQGERGTCFISNVFYVPDIVHLDGDSWVWDSTAKRQMEPYMVKFERAMVRVIPESKLDLEGVWNGMNEMNMTFLKVSRAALSERRTRIQGGHEALVADCEEQSQRVIPVAL